MIVALKYIFVLSLQAFPLLVNCNRTCVCGGPEPTEESRDDAAPNQFPFMVNIKYDRKMICSGALISPIDVLTSAQCVCDSKLKRTCCNVIQTGKMVVTFGDMDLENNFEKEVSANVEFIRIHPDYDPGSYQNDFAIIRLRKFTTNLNMNNISVICLALDSQKLFVNQPMYQIGWNLMSEEGNITSNKLQYNDVTTMDNNECASEKRSFPITNNMICAKPDDTAEDKCLVDIGGPLVYIDDDDKHILVGITSLSPKRCNIPVGLTGIFARVSSQVKWIVDYSEAENCQEIQVESFANIDPEIKKHYECSMSIRTTTSRIIFALLVLSKYFV